MAQGSLIIGRSTPVSHVEASRPRCRGKPRRIVYADIVLRMSLRRTVRLLIDLRDGRACASIFSRLWCPLQLRIGARSRFGVSAMAGVSWKMAVLMAVLVIFAILEFQVTEAQSTLCAQCAPRAYCYYSSYSGSYYCSCRRGYYGDALLGSGHNGCRRRKLRTWQVVISIIGAVLGAILLLCLCLACLRNCLARRRNRGPVLQQHAGEPVYGYPQQAPYPQQGVPMATYETQNHQKVPGPTGVV